MFPPPTHTAIHPSPHTRRLSLQPVSSSGGGGFSPPAITTWPDAAAAPQHQQQHQQQQGSGGGGGGYVGMVHGGASWVPDSRFGTVLHCDNRGAVRVGGRGGVEGGEDHAAL